jgi:glycerol-3-phosphate dehydrogenase
MEYMLTTLREVFPEITIKREEIVFVYCGVRPLPSSDGVTANISRGHSMQVTPADAQRPFPLYSLVGGKWTTFRAFSEQVADRVLGELKQERRCGTGSTAIGGGKSLPVGDDARRAWVARLAEEKGLSAERAASLVSRYGAEAGTWAVAGEVPLKTLPDYTMGEIHRIVSQESVEHLPDLICRRSLIAIMGQATPPVLAELADVAGELLGWDAARRQREVEDALAEVRVPA